jgi:hypothetical protein
VRQTRLDRPGERHTDKSRCQQLCALRGADLSREWKSLAAATLEGLNVLRSAPIPPPRGTDALADNTPEDWSEPVHGDASLLRLGRLCWLVGGCALRSERNLVYL